MVQSGTIGQSCSVYLFIAPIGVATTTTHGPYSERGPILVAPCVYCRRTRSVSLLVDEGKHGEQFKALVSRGSAT